MTCNEITVALNSSLLLNNISFSLHNNERTALLGNNGCGKSTLLNLITNSFTPDKGEIIWRRNTRLGVIEQFVKEDLLELSIIDAVKQNASINLFESEWELNLLLYQIGFHEDIFLTQVKSLSGGWKNRLLLARALAAEPDFLLLDEPTNHMDLATLLFFEDFIKELSIPYLVISHDREFLDLCTTRTLFLREGKIFDFPFSYSRARQALLSIDEADKVRRRNELKEIDRVTTSAKQLATWGKVYNNEIFSRRAESMFKRIEKMQKNVTDIVPIDKRKLTIDTSENRAKYAVTFENTKVSVLNKNKQTVLFSVDKVSISRGDRIVLLGKNGCGKSVFLRSLAEHYKMNLANNGIRFNPQTNLGYYDQMLAGISQSKSLFSILREISTGSDLNVKQNLIAAGFLIDDHFKTTSELSGGQRARLQILLISTLKPNFLLLDEPTNHIDIVGCEALEQEILNSKVTLFFSSHDRRFISNVANRFMLIHNGKMLEINDPEEYYAMEIVDDKKMK